MENLESVLSAADIITLHATPSAEHHALLDRQAFSSCKKGIIIINTARESLIDEEDLVTAIRDGIVGGIALDVFDKKHMAALIDATPNIILTPHIASNTRHSRSEMENEAVNNLIRGSLRGSMMKALVTGGNGFLGHYIVRHLLGRGIGTIIFDREEMTGLWSTKGSLPLQTSRTFREIFSMMRLSGTQWKDVHSYFTLQQSQISMKHEKSRQEQLK